MPDWLKDFQNPSWPEYFAEYARAFAERYPWVRYYTPVNEIYVTAQFSAAFGWWNERLMSDTAFVTNIKHCVKASVLCMRTILDLRPDAIFIFSESDRICASRHAAHGDQAQFMNERRFLSLDLLFGHDVTATMYQYLLAGGMSNEEYPWFRQQKDLRTHCIMGTDYYITNEHVIRERRDEHGGRRCVRILRHHAAVLRSVPHAGDAHGDQPHLSTWRWSGCGRNG